ncbi:hypothetical protein NPS34_00195 [Pseudomonas putida]|uniref:hypothetical protein n=1 Tax=Pseudomonas putida TaxID=303 RepID=UPI00059ABA1E|nr:hypothetical protein [Pseudomonas putida]MDD1996473.1 hypothetical protein [Pseudomonas putida]
MKNVRLIRHGDSAPNAGEPTRDHASITLTTNAWSKLVCSLVRFASDLAKGPSAFEDRGRRLQCFDDEEPPKLRHKKTAFEGRFL